MNNLTKIIKGKQGLENHEKKEWGGWEIVSEMLNNPDEYDIYPTSKCYKKLYDFVCEQKKKTTLAIIEQIVKDLEGRKKTDENDENFYINYPESEGYNQSVDDTITQLQKTLEELK